MVKGVIFDRDGTLIKYKPYLYKIDEVELIAGAKECINKLLDQGYLLFLHTNQSGVARGYFQLQDVEDVNNKMLQMLGFWEKPLFKEICIAPELTESSDSLRKPSPKFALQIMEKYNISQDNLFMIGDNKSDVETAIAANCNGIWFSSEWSLRSEENNISYNKLHIVNTFENLTNILINHHVS